MNRSTFALLALVGFVGGSHAAGFAPLALTDPGETCYSWEGGHKSAGSFSKCAPTITVAVLAPPPPAPAPVLLQSPVCPPQVILEPEPEKKRAPIRRKPRPKLTC